MKPQPIFVHLTLAEVNGRALHLKRVGDRFRCAARGPCGDPPWTQIEGDVVFMREGAHGKLFILRNLHVGDLRYHCSGWTYIPIWIGCGQNGVLASWKDVDSQSHLEAQRAIDEFTEMCKARQRERAVASAMAL